MSDDHKREDDEPIEGRIPDHPQDGDFVDGFEGGPDERDTRGGKRRGEGFSADALFGSDGVFGNDGVFGPGGPFGRNGPFGPRGPFGDSGPFGAGWGGGWGSGAGGGPRGNRARWKMAGGHDAGHRGQHRRKRMFGPGELRLVLLALIAGERKHGYELIKEIEDLTGGEYAPSPGVIYPTLSLLEDEGLIAPVEAEDTRKAFRVTDAGMAELEERSDEVARLMQRLGKQGEKAKPSGSPDLLRALGNLATVITNRAANGQFSGESKDKVVDLIDELARKIERL